MSYHTGLQVLRAKVCGLQSAGLKISSRISESEGARRNALWNEKRALGLHNRYHLVAYGLLRGVPYYQIERCAPDNRLDPKRLLDIMVAHNGVVLSSGKLPRWTTYTLDSVKELLTSEECLTVPAVPVGPAPTTNTAPTSEKRSEGLFARVRTALLEKRSRL